MIAHLKGLLVGAEENRAVVDVMGIGFEVLCSSKTLSSLEVGKDVLLQIELQVREQDMVMFGFKDGAEKYWFRKLMTVQGVGGKVALAVLSALSLDELTRALSFGDTSMITRADGVGPKLASRIVTELKDKALDGPVSLQNTPQKKGEAAPSSILSDAISALSNLGYSRDQAAQMVQKVLDASNENDLDTLIKKALRG